MSGGSYVTVTLPDRDYVGMSAARRDTSRDKSHEANVPGQSNEPLDERKGMLFTPKGVYPKRCWRNWIRLARVGQLLYRIFA